MCAGKKVVAELVSSLFSRRAALAVSAAFASTTGVAGEKLDMSFIRGVPLLSCQACYDPCGV